MTGDSVWYGGWPRWRGEWAAAGRDLCRFGKARRPFHVTMGTRSKRRRRLPTGRSRRCIITAGRISRRQGRPSSDVYDVRARRQLVPLDWGRPVQLTVEARVLRQSAAGAGQLKKQMDATMWRSRSTGVERDGPRNTRRCDPRPRHEIRALSGLTVCAPRGRRGQRDRQCDDRLSTKASCSTARARAGW